MSRIILASQSPRRKNLLKQIGIRFEIHPSEKEEVITDTNPIRIVQDLAMMKARDVARKYPDSLIIGADTIVVFNKQILGKPANTEEALSILKQLSDSTHAVYTGVALVKTDKTGDLSHTHTFYEQTKVTFSALEIADMKAYIKTGSPMDKAGAYGIQDDLGALFVEKIEGDYYNVVGLPLNRLYRELKLFLPEFRIINS
jgi:septum formation protein